MGRIDKLLRPRSIAVIGGGAWGRSVVRNCREVGFAGDIWPVHPSVKTVEGLPAVATLADLPGVPDAAYIAVNRHRTIEAVRDLAAMGCGGVVSFASGFLEAQAEDASGKELQRQLLEAAGDMTLIGPNCYGFVNYLDGAVLWPDQHGGARIEGGVAIITQSSNMGINISMQRRGLPLAYVSTVGNQAQTGLSDLGAAMLEDARVTALGLHIEGIDSISGFENLAATARRLGKPIVALKVGKSEAARAATVSHTASLAGSDAGASALLARLGIARVESLPAFLETLKLLHVCGPLASNRIASMSCSGGEASLMADTALTRGLEFPPLVPHQKEALREALGPMVALSNPLDYHTYIWGDADAMGATYSAMMTGDLALGMIILDYPRQDRCQLKDWYDVAPGALRAKDENNTPMALVATLYECMPENEALKLVDQGIAPLIGLDEALAAVEAAAWLGRVHEDQAPVLAPGEDRDADVMSEAEAKAGLADFGVNVPRAVRAGSPEEAGAATEGLNFPVVLKGEGFAHKTESGAVKLGLMSDEAVAAAAAGMNASGYLVEEMVTGGVAELLIGVVRDPAHGFVLTLGAGGQLTELLEDSASLLVPSRREAVDIALSGLRISKVLDGYRGQRGADRSAVLNAVMAVQEFVIAHADKLEEIEINPLIATANRAVAVDALLRMG